MDRAAIEDLLAPFRPVTLRRMFGGYGVYADGVCFAIALRGDVWLKADAQSRGAFDEAGCRPFSYQTKRRAVVATSYWSMPDGALDDEDALRDWCGKALEAARRSAVGKATRPSRPLGGDTRRATGNFRGNRLNNKVVS